MLKKENPDPILPVDVELLFYGLHRAIWVPSSALSLADPPLLLLGRATSPSHLADRHLVYVEAWLLVVLLLTSDCAFSVPDATASAA